MNLAIECSGVGMTYASGSGASIPVLDLVDLAIDRGESCVLVGPSGSGKTTLLGILGCLLSPSAGEIQLCGSMVDFSDRRGLEARRRLCLGFVFQHSRLLPFLDAAGNVAIAARNAGMGKDEAGRRSVELLKGLGLSGREGHRPESLSGGQRQRVAIARALVHRPQVVLADEPTASLDWRVGEEVVDLLLRHVQATGAALLAVTHDLRLVGKFDRAFRLEQGRLAEDSA